MASPKKKTRRKSTSRADPVSKYARAVVAGRLQAGPHVRAACRRHLRDLKEGKERGLKWDLAAANDAIEFFPAVLRLNGGEFEGLPFHLMDWQKFVVGSLFGWKASDGFRRFRMAFNETGKGSGKSPLAAGIGIYGMVADGEARAEIYAAAKKKDQAAILFRDAVAMVDLSPALGGAIKKSGRKPVWNLSRGGSFFRPISSDDGQSGPRPHIGLLDEIHEHPDNTMVEMMRAGTKGRRQALIFMITNSGSDRTSVAFEYHTYGIKVAAGEIADDSFFAYICALDEDDDPFKDESCWGKANPSMGITFGEKYLREQVTQARGMPSKESIVRRLNFCEWVDAADPWIDRDLWEAAQADDLGELDGVPCFLGMDLSDKRDLTALAAVWRMPDGKLKAKVWFWSPKDTLEERGRQDRVPYLAWDSDERGFFNAVPGRMINKGYVAKFVQEFDAENEVEMLAYDQAKMDDFVQACDDIGLDAWIYAGPDEPEGTGLKCMRHGQGYQGFAQTHRTLWMNTSIEDLEQAVVDGDIEIEINPCLTWNSASAVLEKDPSGNRKWNKRKSTGRIDGIVALCMAVGAAMSKGHDGTSVYETRGALVL